MANYYVYSGAAGAGTGATWADAYTTLTAAVSGKAAGDTFYIAHDHAESTAGAVTITSPGSRENQCRFLCVNRAGSVPPVSTDLRTTATITTTGANDITTLGDSWYAYGLIFTSGDEIKLHPNQGSIAFYKSCKFALSGSGGTISIALGSTVTWDNCTVQFANASQSIKMDGGKLTWRNTSSAVLGTLPTELFTITEHTPPWLIEGVDLSAVTGTIMAAAFSKNLALTAKDCKVAGGVTLSGRPWQRYDQRDFIRCDSGATNYRTERHRYEGVLTTETTVVRTGGASDGTTPISWKIVTNSDPEWQMPFECFPIAIWNETTSVPITVTVEGIWGDGAVPLNDEIWMDVEYLGNASYPSGSFVTTTKADILATGTNTTASSETWGGSTTEFKLVASVTPQMKGPITVYVKVAKVSSTFYIDPKITLS